jgi:hypothetical protein
MATSRSITAIFPLPLMKPSDAAGLLAPRNAPDSMLIQGAFDAYTSSCVQAGIEPQPVETGQSTIRRRVWRGAYTGAVVCLNDGKDAIAIYDVSAERRQRWDEPVSQIHWSFDRAYTPEQLRAFEPLCAEVKSWWVVQVAKWRENGGPPGSFVTGAGIAARVLRPRCRNTDWEQIIYAPSREAGGASGCWEPFVDEILMRLMANGLVASYQPGRLD